jgi:hypothetical protein
VKKVEEFAVELSKEDPKNIGMIKSNHE